MFNSYNKREELRLSSVVKLTSHIPCTRQCELTPYTLYHTFPTPMSIHATLAHGAPSLPWQFLI